MATQSNDSRSVSSGGSSDDTTTLREENEHLKEELAANEERMKKYEEKVSELEDKIKKLHDLVRPQVTPPSSPLKGDENFETPLRDSIGQSTQGTTKASRKLSLEHSQDGSNTEGGQDGSNTDGRQEGSNTEGRQEGINTEGGQEGSNTDGRQEGSNTEGDQQLKDSELSPNETPLQSPSKEGMAAVPRKLELMVGQVTHITEEVTTLKKDFELAYALLPPKPKAVYEGIQTVRKFKKAPNPEDVHVKNYVRYFDPNVPNQDECVKGHPLRKIARRCARISTSKDEGHIYVALMIVDGQCKHYVGKAKAWMNRWQADSTSHEKQIQNAVQLLLTQIQQLVEVELSRLLDLQHCDIEMGVAILKHFQNTEQCKQIIVAYKIQCSLSKTDTVSRSYLNPYEQHFMNAFSDSEYTSEKLNAMNAHTSHSKDACPFSRSGYNETCKSFLEKVLKFFEEDWQQNITHIRCIPPAEHPEEPLHHPFMDIVQRVVRASERDSNTTGARVHIALISTSRSDPEVIEFNHYIGITKCNGKTIDEMNCLLLEEGDARHCEIFNYMCTDEQHAIKMLTAIGKAAKAGSGIPQVCLYTTVAKKVRPVNNEVEFQVSNSTSLMLSRNGWRVMEVQIGH